MSVWEDENEPVESFLSFEADPPTRSTFSPHNLPLTTSSVMNPNTSQSIPSCRGSSDNKDVNSVLKDAYHRGASRGLSAALIDLLVPLRRCLEDLPISQHNSLEVASSLPLSNISRGEDNSLDHRVSMSSQRRSASFAAPLPLHRSSPLKSMETSRQSDRMSLVLENMMPIDLESPPPSTSLPSAELPSSMTSPRVSLPGDSIPSPLCSESLHNTKSEGDKFPLINGEEGDANSNTDCIRDDMNSDIVVANEFLSQLDKLTLSVPSPVRTPTSLPSTLPASSPRTILSGTQDALHSGGEGYQSPSTTPDEADDERKEEDLLRSIKSKKYETPRKRRILCDSEDDEDGGDREEQMEEEDNKRGMADNSRREVQSKVKIYLGDEAEEAETDEEMIGEEIVGDEEDEASEGDDCEADEGEEDEDEDGMDSYNMGDSFVVSDEDYLHEEAEDEEGLEGNSDEDANNGAARVRRKKRNRRSTYLSDSETSDCDERSPRSSKIKTALRDASPNVSSPSTMSSPSTSLSSSSSSSPSSSSTGNETTDGSETDSLTDCMEDVLKGVGARRSTPRSSGKWQGRRILAEQETADVSSPSKGKNYVRGEKDDHDGYVKEVEAEADRKGGEVKGTIRRVSKDDHNARDKSTYEIVFTRAKGKGNKMSMWEDSSDDSDADDGHDDNDALENQDPNAGKGSRRNASEREGVIMRTSGGNGGLWRDGTKQKTGPQRDYDDEEESGGDGDAVKRKRADVSATPKPRQTPGRKAGTEGKTGTGTKATKTPKRRKQARDGADSNDDDDDDSNGIDGLTQELARLRLKEEEEKKPLGFAKLKRLAPEYYKQFNEEVFEALPSDMPIVWNARLQSTAGRCIFKLIGGERAAVIELSKPVLTDLYRLKNTLIHEMCHAATWLIDGLKDPGHGASFKRWGQRCMSRYPDIIVSTCHNYEIIKKFQYQCANDECPHRTVYQRNSDSIRPDKHCCPHCRSPLIRINLPTSSTSFSSSNAIPSTPTPDPSGFATPSRQGNATYSVPTQAPVTRTPSAFAVFVQAHMSEIKALYPTLGNRERMQMAASWYNDQKKMMKTLTSPQAQAALSPKPSPPSNNVLITTSSTSTSSSSFFSSSTSLTSIATSSSISTSAPHPPIPTTPSRSTSSGFTSGIRNWFTSTPSSTYSSSSSSSSSLSRTPSLMYLLTPSTQAVTHTVPTPSAYTPRMWKRTARIAEEDGGSNENEDDDEVETEEIEDASGTTKEVKRKDSRSDGSSTSPLTRTPQEGKHDHHNEHDYEVGDENIDDGETGMNVLLSGLSSLTLHINRQTPQTTYKYDSTKERESSERRPQDDISGPQTENESVARSRNLEPSSEGSKYEPNQYDGGVLSALASGDFSRVMRKLAF